MKNKKIMMWVRNLASYENGFVEFRKHIQVVDTTRGGNMVKLFVFLWKEVTEHPDEDPDREDAFKAVFGKKTPYDKRKMMDLINNLAKRLEDFIMLVYFREDSTLMQKKLAEIHRNNRNDKYFFKAVEDLKQGMDKEEAKHYYLRSEINHDYYFYQSESNHHQEFGDALNEHIDDLNTFHAIRYLKAASEKLMKYRIRGISIDKNLLKKIKAYLLFMDEPRSPKVELLIYVIRFYLRPDMVNYENLKKNLIEKLDTIETEKKSLLNFLINALSVFPFSGDLLQEYFTLYKLAVEKDLLKENGIVGSRVFNNIVGVSHLVKEYEWGERFVESHFNYLEVTVEVKEHILQLAKCYSLFGREQYNEVLKELEFVKNIDFSYTVRKHVLAFKSEYEKNKLDAIAGIEEREGNFRRLFHRITSEKQVNKTYQLKHFNFLNLLKKIALFHFGKYTKKQLLEIFQNSQDAIVEALWLKDKIEELN